MTPGRKFHSGCRRIEPVIYADARAGQVYQLPSEYTESFCFVSLAGWLAEASGK